MVIRGGWILLAGFALCGLTGCSNTPAPEDDAGGGGDHQREAQWNGKEMRRLCGEERKHGRDQRQGGDTFEPGPCRDRGSQVEERCGPFGQVDPSGNVEGVVGLAGK